MIKVNERDYSKAPFQQTYRLAFILIILSMILFSSTVMASQTTKYNAHIQYSIVDETDPEVLYINANTYYEFGKEVAKRFPILFSTLKHIAGDISNEELNDTQNATENMDPDFYSELNGLADDLDVSYVQAIHLLNTFYYYIPDIECTTSLTTGMATKGADKTFLTQNIDESNYQNRKNYTHFLVEKLWISRHVLSAYHYAHIGLPLFWELPIVNEKMLGMGGNGLILHDPPLPDNGTGWGTYWLEIKTLMQETNIDDVEKLWNRTPRESGDYSQRLLKFLHRFDNSISAWCDKNGGILMIEQMSTYFNPVRKNPDDPIKTDFLWHSNHHLWNKGIEDDTGSIVPDPDDSTYKRAKEAYDFLEEHYYRIDSFTLLRDFITYHGPDGVPDSGDICRHNETPPPQDKLGETMLSWVIDPKHSMLYRTGGWNTPCKSIIIPTFLNLKFGESESEGYMTKYVSSNPLLYNYEIGSIPYVFEKTQADNDFGDRGTTGEDDNASLIVDACISDFMKISNNLQANHDYTLSLMKGDEKSSVNVTISADMIVNASLPADDPVNHTWRTIQKAIDNSSTLHILIIEQGNFTENITLNKSLILLGADENHTILNGSITMVNPHDYVLLNTTDPIMNVNMTGIQCLLHFDNASDTGRGSTGLPTIIHDYSPLRHDGTNHNATLTNSTMKGNSALHFNGINTSINLTSIPALTGKNTTLSAWVHWTGSNHTQNPIISQSNQTQGYCLLINGTTNTPVFRLNNHTITANTTITNGWHQIIGTHNTTTLRLYVDGTLTASTTTTDSGINQEAFIGCDNTTHYFNGTIDEVAVWNRTLSASEITHLYSLNYGVVLDGITITNGDIGIQPVNHTDITNCRLLNHTTGITINNLCDLKIQCTIANCGTAIDITDTNPDNNNRIRLMDCAVTQSTNGFHISHSSNLDIIRTSLNCTHGPLVFMQSNYSTITIRDTTCWGNQSPDQPSLTGPSLGTINTPCTYHTCTNDSNNDNISYLFDWGDGNTSGWLGPYLSNVRVNATHTWAHHGGYHVTVQAKDIFSNTSDSPTDILFRTETLPPIIHTVQCQPMLVTAGWNATITANVSDDTASNWSGIHHVTVNITYPDQTSRNLTLSQETNNTYTFVFPETWLFGQYNYTLWAVDNAENSRCSTVYNFTVPHSLGDTRIGPSSESVHDIIRASRFTLDEDALVHNITAYVNGVETPTFDTPTYQCMIYRASDGQLQGSTAQEKQYTTGWHTFTFTPRPVLHHNTSYYLAIWGDNPYATMYYSSQNPGNGYSNSSHSFGVPPQTIGWNSTSTEQYSLFCTYDTDIYPPWIINVSHAPETVGFGYTVAIHTNITDNKSGVNAVSVNITYPDHTHTNYTMSLVSGSHYRYLFADTWTTGQYNYTIYATDIVTNLNSSAGHHFNVSANSTISIATLKDSYTGSQYINITDPPNPPENLTVISRGLTWNTLYNASSGNNILESYQGPVNYQDNSGSWTPINNTLFQLSSDHPAYNYGYRTGNNHGLFGVYFKPDVSSDRPVAFTYNRSNDPTVFVVRSKLVGVGYLDPSNNWSYHYLQSVQGSQGQTRDYSIIYPNVFTGANVTWSYGATGLKEAITMSNATRTVLQDHPPHQYGLNDANSYLVFITKLEYQNLNLYNASGMLSGNVTIDECGVDFKDALGFFRCGMPIGDAFSLCNESMRVRLMYRIVRLHGDTYVLSGVKVSQLNMMMFPVVVDPTLTVYSTSSDGYGYNSSTNYNTAQAASSGTVNTSGAFITIGQKRQPGNPTPTYYVDRGFVFFNTSALPSNAYLDNATLSLYKKDDFSTTDFDITVQNGQPTHPHNPLQIGDYNKNYYSGNGGSMNTSGFTSGYNAIPLTSLGLINRTGMTKLCLRSSRDINAKTPTGSEYVNVYSDEFTGICPPKLVIIYRNQSKVKNTGSTAIKGYLLIQVQFFDSTLGKWLVDKDTINETSPRTLSSSTGNQLALDLIFNGHVRASDLTHGTGTYRVYTAFRDPDGNILKTSSGVELKAWWEFIK